MMLFLFAEKTKVFVNNTKMAVLDDLNRAYQKLIEIDTKMAFFDDIREENATDEKSKFCVCIR